MFRINVLGLDIYGCQEALERLDEYVDRELTPDENRKVRQHLKICHQCARKFAFEEEFVAGMRGKIAQVVPSPDLDALKSNLSQMLRQKIAEENEETSNS
jgi:anti-sigma factor RsiW